MVFIEQCGAKSPYNKFLRWGIFMKQILRFGFFKPMKKMVKKCSTDQRFIRKRNTTYRIHTLVCKLQCSICSQATRISYAQVHSTINNTFSITSFRISFGMTSNCLIFNTKIWQHSKILICESVVWGRPDHSRVCETLIWKSSN